MTDTQPEPTDPTQRTGDEGFCPEHGYHRHSLKQPGPIDDGRPIRKGLLPCRPPSEWEFHTVFGARTGSEGCALFPGDEGPVVVRRRVTYGDWEPVRPDCWADEPDSPNGAIEPKPPACIHPDGYDADPRIRAHAAVHTRLRALGDWMPFTTSERDVMVWSAVHDALNAAGVPQPADDGDGGPSVREAAADDRRWSLERHGE